MELIKPRYDFLTKINDLEIYKQLEIIARTCYKSEDKITDISYEKLITHLIKNNHEAMIEHCIISVKITCDRAIANEIVRHRIASYAQESTRYVNYGKKDKQLTFIIPPWVKIESGSYNMCENPTIENTDCIWYNMMIKAESTYLQLIDFGWTPEKARTVLPCSIKTEIVVTMNLREWRCFFKLRTALAAHPQMREITIPLLKDFKTKLPIIFNDIEG